MCRKVNQTFIVWGSGFQTGFPGALVFQGQGCSKMERRFKSPGKAPDPSSLDQMSLLPSGSHVGLS